MSMSFLSCQHLKKKKINCIPPFNQLNIYSNLQLVISSLTKFPLLLSRICEELLQMSEALKLNQPGEVVKKPHNQEELQ